MNLLEKITPEDKDIMIKYISLYGTSQDFIGLDNWLKSWSFSKRRLFKLLGGRLIYKIPFSQKKDKKILSHEIKDVLFEKTFKQIYHSFYLTYIVKWRDSNVIDASTAKAFSSVTDVENFINDAITKPIKMRKEGAKKMLQIQKGTKPVRALQRILNYFDEEFQTMAKDHFLKKPNYCQQAFEDFRITHSMILNDKTLKGTLCISIHPMDFITMSDNDSDWSSCMSWKDNGCYKIGSVEMMNSNNVLCCYLESSKPFYFGEDSSFKWNNKKWRTLVYFNKDIIMSGKSYPYPNDDLSKTIISIVKDLASKNINRYYSFGPELYKDMIHINNLSQMNNNYSWLQQKDNFKHNIIWDTKGMYNDMLNDNKTKYWCYRNKVKHKKIYSISGKAPCLCCGNTVIEYDDTEEDYNDRYSFASSLICYPCEQNHTCVKCRSVLLKQPLLLYDSHSKICQSCYDKYIKLCPHCGKIIDLGSGTRNRIGFYKNEKASFRNPNYVNFIFNSCDLQDNREETFEPLYCCEECAEYLIENFKWKYSNLQSYAAPPTGWRVFYSNPELKKFRYLDLQSVPYEKYLTLNKNFVIIYT